VVEQLLANLFPEKEYQWEILRTSIQNMLRATPNTLKDVLDQDDIDPMENLVEEKFEKLGEQIPDDVVAILITDPYRPLKKDAMVAYEFEEDKYVYAKLLESYEVVVDPSGSILIDIGEPQPCTVPILDIHFFPLIKENQNGDFALVVRDSGDNNTGAGGDNFEREESRFEDILVIFAKITAQMEEMYKTLKEDKKAWLKFVKRMVFKWHPDKNPEEKATEVTQFILNEAVRIWSGVQGQASSGGGSWSDPSGFSNDFYEEMFRQWGEQARSHRFTRERYHSNFSSRSSFHREEYKESQRWGVPPSFESNNLPAARLWLEVGKSDLKSAQSNLAARHFMWAAYTARMAMERSVKSVELTCNRQPTTTTHDIPPVLARLPQDWEITEDLKAAWATVPSTLKGYTAILYRGLNQHTGEDPREFFRDHAEDIEEAIEIAERDFLQFAEKHLEKFENDKK